VCLNSVLIKGNAKIYGKTIFRVDNPSIPSENRITDEFEFDILQENEEFIIIDEQI
jgi:hypothetical protein